MLFYERIRLALEIRDPSMAAMRRSLGGIFLGRRFGVFSTGGFCENGCLDVVFGW
jgi:hypothetical protein